MRGRNRIERLQAACSESWQHVERRSEMATQNVEVETDAETILPLTRRISRIFLVAKLCTGILRVLLGLFIVVVVFGTSYLEFALGPIVGPIACAILVFWGGYDLVRVSRRWNWQMALDDRGIQVGNERLEWPTVTKMEHRVAANFDPVFTITGTDGKVLTIPACGCGGWSAGRELGVMIGLIARKFAIPVDFHDDK